MIESQPYGESSRRAGSRPQTTRRIFGALLAAASSALAQDRPPTLTPTPAAAIVRGTPVSAGGSLQDFARRKHGLDPKTVGKGSLSVSGPEELRHESLTARPITDGLLVEGRAIDERERRGTWHGLPEFSVLEVSATRRDGKVVRSLAPLKWDSEWIENRLQMRGRVRRASISRTLYAPTRPDDPASLIPESVRARFHTPPEIRPEDRPGYRSRIGCLRYWAKPARSPSLKEDADNLVEVHVINSCTWALPADEAWFEIWLFSHSLLENVEQKIYGVFPDGVPARSEIEQGVPARVKKDQRVRIEPFRYVFWADQ